MARSVLNRASFGPQTDADTLVRILKVALQELHGLRGHDMGLPFGIMTTLRRAASLRNGEPPAIGGNQAGHVSFQLPENTGHCIAWVLGSRGKDRSANHFPEHAGWQARGKLSPVNSGTSGKSAGSSAAHLKFVQLTANEQFCVLASMKTLFVRGFAQDGQQPSNR